jgi:TRAP-type uncharacterized transport system fused permease subunit
MMSVALVCAAAGIIVGVVNMGIGGMITQIVETLALSMKYALFPFGIIIYRLVIFHQKRRMDAVP